MVNLSSKNNYPTHTFLVYKNKDDDGWNWFENSDFNNRGIHKFDDFNDLITYQLQTYKQFLKTFNITEEELSKIIIKEFDKPKSCSSAEEYLEWVINSKNNINLEHK